MNEPIPSDQLDVAEQALAALLRAIAAAIIIATVCGVIAFIVWGIPAAVRWWGW